MQGIIIHITTIQCRSSILIMTSHSHPETAAMLNNPHTVAVTARLLEFLNTHMTGEASPAENPSGSHNGSASSSLSSASSGRLADGHPSSSSQSQGDSSNASVQNSAPGGAPSSTYTYANVTLTRARPFAPTSQSTQPAYYSQVRRVREGRATSVEVTAQQAPTQPATTQPATTTGSAGADPGPSAQADHDESIAEVDQTLGCMTLGGDISPGSGWARGTEELPAGSLAADLGAVDPYLVQQQQSVSVQHQDDYSFTQTDNGLTLLAQPFIPQENSLGLLPTNQQGDQLGNLPLHAQMFPPAEQQTTQQVNVSRQDPWMYAHQQGVSTMPPPMMLPPPAISPPASTMPMPALVPMPIPAFQSPHQTLPSSHDQTQSNRNPAIHSTFPHGFGQEMLHRVPFHLQNEVPQELIDMISRQAADAGIPPSAPVQQDFFSDYNDSSSNNSGGTDTVLFHGLSTDTPQFNQTLVSLPGDFTTITFASEPALDFATGGANVGVSEMATPFQGNVPQALMDPSMSVGPLGQQWLDDELFPTNQGHPEVQSDDNYLTYPPTENNISFHHDRNINW